MKIIEKNKKAYFEYELLEKLEAGIVLVGCEVKSIRAGKVSIKEGFCYIEGEELWLKNAYIAPYDRGSYNNVEPRRDRKLLLHKREIKKLVGKSKTKGLTIVPTMLYFKDGKAKLEIALAKGKKLYDKRKTIKEREIKKQSERDIKNR